MDDDHHYASCPMYAHLSFGSRNARETNSQNWDEAVVRTGIAKCRLVPRADIYRAAPSVLLDERGSASHPLT